MTTSNSEAAASRANIANVGDLSSVSYLETVVVAIPDSLASRAWVSPACVRSSRTTFIDPTNTAFGRHVQEFWFSAAERIPGRGGMLGVVRSQVCSGLAGLGSAIRRHG
ncbi:MAG: hypothetical protein U9N56_06095 [Actinomycetota bacterium]|nr:hypothetical protein [Actinomycetota bacterium]